MLPVSEWVPPLRGRSPRRLSQNDETATSGRFQLLKKKQRGMPVLRFRLCGISILPLPPSLVVQNSACVVQTATPGHGHEGLKEVKGRKGTACIPTPIAALRQLAGRLQREPASVDLMNFAISALSFRRKPGSRYIMWPPG